MKDKDSDFTCHHHLPKTCSFYQKLLGTKDLTGSFGDCKVNAKHHESNGKLSPTEWETNSTCWDDKDGEQCVRSPLAPVAAPQGIHSYLHPPWFDGCQEMKQKKKQLQIGEWTKLSIKS